MIACLAKNDRARPLFSLLASDSRQFQDLGVVHGDAKALKLGFLASLPQAIAQAKLDARFSAPYLDAFERECARRVEAAQPRAVVYWGATNRPTRNPAIPYYIITDGPYDPNDASFPPEWRPNRPGAAYLARQRDVYRGALHVFTLSEWARQKVMQVHGLAPEAVTRIGWGPIGQFGEPRFCNSKNCSFVSIGSEWKRKGMDIAAEAGARLAAEFPGAETVLAGDPAGFAVAERPGVRLMAQRTPAETCHRLMRDANALIVASRFDASPHVIYEAMQYGTPVLVSPRCGMPEAVTPGAGTVLPELSSEALHQAMREYVDDREDRRRAAFAAYRDSGGWAAVADKVRAVVLATLD